MIDSSCKVISGKQFKKNFKLVKLFAMASRSSDADEAEVSTKGCQLMMRLSMSGPERCPT